MRVIGFNFTKISGEKSNEFNPEFSINTNLNISDIKEEKAEVLKDFEVIKVSFKFEVTYNSKEKKEVKFGEVALAGEFVFSSDKDAKDLLQSWNKKSDKTIPEDFKVPLFNLIMRRCTTKALELEESLNLPFHIPFPQVREPTKQEAKKEKK